MASSMSNMGVYNHRSLQPSASGSGSTHNQNHAAPANSAGPGLPTPHSNHGSSQPIHPSLLRVSSTLSHLQQTYTTMLSEASAVYRERDAWEARVNTQMNELAAIRDAVHDLESEWARERETMRAEADKLDKEIERYREKERQQHQQMSQSHPHANALDLHLHTSPNANPQPPTPIGPGSKGGINGPSSASGSAGPFPDPYYIREQRESAFDRDRERERERESGRDRDLRERDRERDHRDAKRFKSGHGHAAGRATDRDIDMDRDVDIPMPSPSLGPGHNGLSRNMPSGSGPMQLPMPKLPPPPQTPQAYSTAAPASANIHPPPGAMDDSNVITSPPVTLDVTSVPPEYVFDARMSAKGGDWSVIYNPDAGAVSPGRKGKGRRIKNLRLVHGFMHESVVCTTRFSADGRYLATGCNKTAAVFDVERGEKVHSLSPPSPHGSGGDLYIRSVCFSPDGKFLATGAEDRGIRIYALPPQGSPSYMVLHLTGHQQEIYSLDWSPDGRLLVSGSGDKTVRIWDLSALNVGHRNGHKELTTETTPCQVLTINDSDSLNNDAGVTSVAFSPCGTWVVAGSLDCVVRVWEVGGSNGLATLPPSSGGDLREKLKGHGDSVYSVAWMRSEPPRRGEKPRETRLGLVSGSLDRSCKYWDLSSLASSSSNHSGVKSRKEGLAGASGDVGKGKCTMNFLGHKDYILSTASTSTSGSTFIVSGSKDRSVIFWDAQTAVMQCVLNGHKNSVISIDTSPVSNLVATGSGDWQARVWAFDVEELDPAEPTTKTEGA